MGLWILMRFIVNKINSLEERINFAWQDDEYENEI